VVRHIYIYIYIYIYMSLGFKRLTWQFVIELWLLDGGIKLGAGVIVFFMVEK